MDDQKAESKLGTPSTIWKYPFEIEDKVRLQVPAGAKLLGVQIQRGGLCAWFSVDPMSPETRRVLAVVGTGRPRPDALQFGVFKATVQTGALAWHIFDMGEGQ